MSDFAMILCVTLISLTIITITMAGVLLLGISSERQKRPRLKPLPSWTTKVARADFSDPVPEPVKPAYTSYFDWGRYTPPGVTYDPSTDTYRLSENLLMDEGQMVLPDKKKTDDMLNDEGE